MSWGISLGISEAESLLGKLILASLSFSLAIVQLLPFIVPLAARAGDGRFEVYLLESEKNNSLLRYSQGPFTIWDYFGDHAFLFFDQYNDWTLAEAEHLPPPNIGPLNHVLERAIDADLTCGNFLRAEKHLRQYLIVVDARNFSSNGDNVLSSLDAMRFWSRAYPVELLVQVLDKARLTMADQGEQMELYLVQLDVLERLAKNGNQRESSTKPRILALADKMYALRPAVPYHPAWRKLAALYFRQGQYAKSKQLLLDWEAATLRFSGARRNPYLYSCFLQDNFLLAQCSLRMQNYSAAAMYVKKAKRNFDSLMDRDSEGRRNLDLARPDFDEALPESEDLVNLERAIATKNSLKQVTFRMDNYINPNLEQIESYRQAGKIFGSMTSANEKLVGKNIENLIAAYQAHKSEAMGVGQLSWYDFMLTCARRLSDQGYVELSEKTLDALDSPDVPRVVEFAEKAVNAFRSSRKMNIGRITYASKLDAPDAVLMRRLGALYSSVGEQERAYVFFNTALGLSGGVSSTLGDRGADFVLLHLDMAVMNMRQSDADKAFTFAQRALVLAEGLSAGPSTSRQFRQSLRLKTSLFLQEALKNKELLRAKYYGEEAEKKLSLAHLKYEVDSTSQEAQFDRTNALLPAAMAEVYFACGEPKLALARVNSALKDLPPESYYSPAALFYLKAMCSAAVADSASAAKAYSDVPTAAQSSMLGQYSTPYLNELYAKYLSIAKGFADRSKDIDPQLKAGIDAQYKQFVKVVSHSGIVEGAKK